MTPQEKQVFDSLKQSGEGQVLSDYLEKVRLSILAELVDGEPSEVEIQAAKLNRKLCLDLQSKLSGRGIIETKEADSFA